MRLEWVQGWRRGSVECRHRFREPSSGVVAGGRVGSSPCPLFTVMAKSKHREERPRQGAQVLDAQGQEGMQTMASCVRGQLGQVPAEIPFWGLLHMFSQ